MRRTDVVHFLLAFINRASRRNQINTRMQTTAGTTPKTGRLPFSRSTPAHPPNQLKRLPQWMRSGNAASKRVQGPTLHHPVTIIAFMPRLHHTEAAHQRQPSIQNTLLPKSRKEGLDRITCQKLDVYIWVSSKNANDGLNENSEASLMEGRQHQG